MLRRNLAYLLFLIFPFSFCIAQNPDGEMSFTVKDKCEAIIFIIDRNDSIFYDTNKKYQLKIKNCFDSCHFFYNANIHYSWIPNPGSFLFQKDSSTIKLNFGFTVNIQIEIKKIKDNTTMNILFKDITDWTFSAYIFFKEGNYLVNLREAYRKEGYPIKLSSHDNLQFQLILSNLKFKKDCSNYSIKTIVAPYHPQTAGIWKWRNFKPAEIKGDTLSLGFDTRFGIDTLIFAIRNNKTNAKMTITVLNFSYNEIYFIDLTKFSPGHYFIDWRKIDKCQRENPCTELIDCDGMKFYQAQEEEASFFCNKIRLYDLKRFRK